MSSTIRARSACTCNARNWFDCRCDVDEVVYEVPVGTQWTIEDTPVPSPAFVRYVAGRHPKWTLIHLPTPAYLAAEYAAAREGR